MAVKNTALIYINGINYTPHAVMPFKWANFLDEQLDEAHVSLRHVDTERFEPFTPVEVVLRSVVSFQNTETVTDEVTKQFIVATDTSEKSPVWSDFYDHELYIIELTKLLESIVIDTCTFTNDAGRTYAGDAQVVEYTSISSGMPTVTNYPEFSSPQASGESITIPSADSVWYGLANGSGRSTYYTYNGWVTVSDGTNTYTAYDDDELELTLYAGCTYTITYTCEYGTSSGGTSEYSIVYVIVCVDNVLPLKKWTITDVVNRLCDIAEPLRKGEYPRFYLNEEQAAKYDYILAPEFSFTKSTFRECLQQVGGVIHGEPRLTAVLQSSDDTEGYADAYRYEISFDEYGGNTYATGADRRYIKRTVSQSIDSYATEIDSSPENLINRLDKYEGVIVEPYKNGYRTVRTDSMYAQITDETMLIETTLPIYTIEELIAGIQDGDGKVVSVDITDYVFESTLYSSQLSSYSSAYPYSKAYGIMYTQGEKNITQLNFKQENPVSSVFSKYAIVNIINEALGDDADEWEFDTSTDYPLLMFRVTYTPLYSARTGQTKPEISGLTYPATQLYNQTANMIETRYYGENMKGAVARFGNPDKAVTYKLARLSQIPTAGEKYDSDYYISAVESELLPTCIRTTITLTKDFNRLSQYVGISSEKRFSEVSQGQAAERSTLWKEYVVVGDQIDEDDEKYGDTPYCAGAPFVMGMYSALSDGSTPFYFTTVRAFGETGQESSLNAVYLPIVSSSFGDSLTFTWSYKDNYSAGTVATKVETEDTDLYYQDDYRYTDYYGKLYYYHFVLETYGSYSSTFSTESGYALKLPSGASSTVTATKITTAFATTERDEPIILRKDNRERLLCDYQIDFVSNRQTLFIGSAFPAMFSSLAGTSRTAYLYILDEELPKFSGHLSDVIDFDSLGTAETVNFVYDTTNYRYVYFYFTASTGGKAWVLLTERTATKEKVEDELGNTTTQTVYEGGDVLLAENKTIGAGAIYSCYLTTMRKIFNPPVWVDKT